MMLSNEILTNFVSMRQSNVNFKASKTLEEVLLDDDINKFLIKNGVKLSLKDEFTAKCILGLIDVAIRYNVHMQNGQTIASATGYVSNKYKIGVIRFNNWLKANNLFEFYKITVELIMFIKTHNLKINALTIVDDVCMKQSQIDGEDDKKPFDRFAVREAVYHTQTYPFDEKEIRPEMVLKARKEAKLTQKEASILVYVDERTWQRWESGDRKMHKSIYELFLIKTGLL